MTITHQSFFQTKISKKWTMSKNRVLLIILVLLPFLTFSQWEHKDVSTNVTLSAVHFQNELVGYVSGANEIYKTEDGGNTWQNILTAGSQSFFEDLFVFDNNNIIAVGKELTSNEALILRSNDSGVNWTTANVSASSFLNSVFFVNSNLGFCAGSSGTILRSNDSGISWEVLNTGVSSTLQSIFFVNTMVGVAIGGGPGAGQILKTADGGNSWNEVTSPADDFLQSVYFVSNETGYAVGWNGEIIKTTDCGDNWTILNSVSMFGNLDVFFTDENTGYIVGGQSFESLIQKTTNAGDLWEDISPNVEQGLIAIHFPTSEIGYTVGGNGTVLKTTSAGVITSTNDFFSKEDFIISPNPSTGIFNIESKKNQTIREVIVYDSNGTILRNHKVNSDYLKLNLENLPINIYYIGIRSKDYRTVKKILKK